MDTENMLNFRNADSNWPNLSGTVDQYQLLPTINCSRKQQKFIMESTACVMAQKFVELANVLSFWAGSH